MPFSAGEYPYSSKVTTTGIPVRSRVRYLPTGELGDLWGVGYDPKGELCMLCLDSGIQTQVRVEEIEIVKP